MKAPNYMHLQCGDEMKFRGAMAAAGVKENQTAVPPSRLYGLEVYENKYIPVDKAVLVGGKGEVIKIFDL